MLPVLSAESKAMLVHGMGATPEYVASCVVDSPAAAPEVLALGCTGICTLGTGKLTMDTSLLSLLHATRRPRRVVAWKVTQSSLWLRASAVVCSNALRHVRDLPSLKTSKSALPRLDSMNLQVCPPKPSIHSGALAHAGPPFFVEQVA